MKPKLSPELAALLAETPEVTAQDRRDLREEGIRWETDPIERAAFHKAAFISAVMTAMDRQGINQTQLAEAWGKTRQYVSSILNRNKKTNFTIETMVELSILLSFPFRIETDAAQSETISSPLETESGDNRKIIPFDGEFQEAEQKSGELVSS
jgi:antitoxin component HigA of HigAB toxin-antitoxin module